MEISVVVKLDQHLQGCFLNLSKGLLWLLQKNQTLAFSSAGFTESVPLVLRVKCPNGKLVAMSWSGGFVCENNDALLISLSPRFANSIGICRDDEVTVCMLEKIHCAQSVIISPLHQGDWELLELNVSHLELTLLSQVRVMFAGLQFPAIVNGSSALLKVESSVPSGYVYLTEGTVLEIVPSQSKRNAEPAPDAPIGSRSLKRHSPEAKSRKLFGDATFEWMCGKVGNFFLRYQGLQGSHNFPSRLEPSKNGHVGAALPVSLASRSDLIGAKLENVLKHVDLVLRSQPILNCSPEIEIVIGDEARLSQGCRRCQSIPYGGRTGASQVCVGKLSSCRPAYQAYVCAASLPVLDCLKLPVVSFCAEVSLVWTPSQLAEQKKEKSTSKDSLRLGLNVTVLPKPEWLTVCGPNWDAVIALNPIVMEQLSIKTGACVRLRCCHRNVETVGAVLLHIPSTREECAAKIEAAFGCYLSRCVDVCGSVLLNQGTLMHFLVAGKSCPAILELIDVRNEIFAAINRSDVGRLAIMSSADEDADGFTKEKYSLCSEPRVSESDLGGVTDVWTRLCSFVESSLFCECCTPRSHGSRHLLNCSRAVLLHGGSDTAAGCGKTSVAQALCGRFQKEPYFVHTEFVDCTSLRGKKVETIEGRWDVMYDELAWRQPSLLVFDDVHQLCGRVDTTQDGGALSLYTNRLVQVFLAFVAKIMRRNDRIFVLATASCVDALHADLVSGTGAGLFQEVVCLGFQCDAQVDEVLQCVMRNAKGFGLNPTSSSAVASMPIDTTFLKSCTFELLDDDIRNFAKMLRNCLPADVKDLVRKAVHIAANSQGASNPVVVGKEHFAAALEDFKPRSLSGLHLHKPEPVSWSAVGGLHSVKGTLQEALLWPSKYPELFSKFPLRLRSGVLLYGAPGTGKTLLASAVAHACGLNFISVKGPELLSKYVGSSEHNVRELFIRAQSAKPCVVFFDEFDSLAPRRGHDNTGVTDRVVNQLLTQLDGVEALDGVFVLGATSRPDLIDPALLRPGRLDRCLYCPMPSAADRLEILTIYARSLTLGDVLDMTWLAESTEHFSGADLKALLYSAQVMAINEMLSLQRSQSDVSEVIITKHHLTEALKASHPSVSSLERARFERIFDSFESSRKSSTSSTMRKSSQKVTFA